MFKSKKSSLNNALFISATAILSRFLGLFRDMLTAWVLGANADALSLALRIPHFLRRLLADGALSQSLTSAIIQNTPKKTLFTAQKSIIICLLFWLMLLFFADYLMALLALGLNQESLEESVLYFRVASPYCLFAVLASKYMARLNAQNNFLASSFSPIIFNLSFLLSLGIFSCLLPFALAASFSMAFAGLAQVLNLFLSSRKNLATIQNLETEQNIANTSSEPVMQTGPKSAKSELSNIIFASSLQLSFLISAFLASFLDSGRMSALFYAEKVIELPLGVMSLALSLISVVKFNEFVKNKDYTSLAQALNKNIAINLYLALPAFFGLLALSDEIVQVLFMHGNFGAEMAWHTAQALQAYAPCLLINALLLPLLIASRALHRQKIIYVLLALAMNLTLGWLIINFSYINPAWATSVGLFLILVLVYNNLRTEIKISFSKKELTRQLILSILIYCLATILATYLNIYLALGLAIVLSVLFYFVLSRDFIQKIKD